MHLFVTSGDDEYPGCCLHVGDYSGTYRNFNLPPILKPHIEKKKLTYVTEDVIAMLGRDWYIETTERRLGFSYLEEQGYLQVWLFGRYSDSSETDQTFSFFIPWKQWRFACKRIYGLNGEIWWSSKIGGVDWEEWEQIEPAIPKRRFAFKDFDGEEIEVSTYIEEREWRRGESWCSWLSLFVPPMIQRSLDLRFSKETGERKGSWKGGTLGTGIEMLPGELHEEAFRRYCDKHEMTFISEVHE